MTAAERSEGIFQRRAALIDAMGENLLVLGDTLAARLGVSVRTIYRDIEALRGAGAPITGEAGVGYMVRRRPERINS